jgi:RHS repeat-associated protein
VATRKVASGGAADVTYQHTDALGSPVATTNAAGALVERERMTAYGEPADGTWSDRPGFTGHQMDAGSRLVYMQQRYYDPAVGKFLSVDSVTTSPSTGAMFNRYFYANNNPHRFLDPDGRAHQVFWSSEKTATVVVPFAVSDPHGVAAFTGDQVAADFNARFSGTTVIDGVEVMVTAVAVEVPFSIRALTNENVNVVNVNPQTTTSTTSEIGGRVVDLRGTAGADVVSHELGHTAGAGDQRGGGVDASGQRVPAGVPASPGAMGDNVGPANDQTRREMLQAPSATVGCAGGVSNGACP